MVFWTAVSFTDLTDYSNEKLQLQRLLSRASIPPLTESQAKSRMAAQMPVSEKLNYATTVIDNSGTLSDLEAQVDRCVAKWRRQQGGATGWWWRLCWLVPPVGLAAGWASLFLTWKRSRKPRRRTRGEADTTVKNESYEMAPLRKRASS